MRPDRRNTRWDDDRHNVADQPGGAIFWSGVILAVILGLLLRGLINPSKVRSRLESAASQIHPSLRVDFENAEVSLADGLWPRFAVVVHRVRMVSTNTCWMSPRLLADEIRLPISITSMLLRASPFGRIEAGEVELRLTASRPAACDRGQVILDGEAAPAPRMRPAIRIVRQDGAPSAPARSSGEVEALSIARLVLVSEVYPQGSVELEDLEFLARSSNPLLFLLRANLSVPRTPGATEDALRAEIQAEYKEFPERLVDFRLNGRLREGAYRLSGSYAPDKDEVKLSADLRHMPLVELFDLLKPRNPGLQNFRPRLSWLSFRAEASGEGKNLNKAPVEITEFQLEGDLGDIAADRLRIESLNPLRFAPSLFQVKTLDVDRLFQFLGRPHPTPILNRLGRFEGDVELTDVMNFRMSGTHSGMEFIFSNQCRRELQSLPMIRGEILRREGNWSLRVNEAEVQSGKFDGQISVTAAPEFQDLAIDLQTREFEVSPAVRALMTGGGEIAPLKGDLKMRFREGRLMGWQGQIQTALVEGRGLRSENLSLLFSERAGRLELQPRMSSLRLPTNLIAEKQFETLIPADWREQDQSLSLSAVNARFQRTEGQAWRWSEFNAKNAKGTLSSQGQWDEAGRLSGWVRVQAGPRPKRFEIEGHRDRPAFQEVGR